MVGDTCPSFCLGTFGGGGSMFSPCKLHMAIMLAYWDQSCSLNPHCALPIYLCSFNVRLSWSSTCLKGLTLLDWLVNGKASITSTSPNLEHNIDYIGDDDIVTM